MDKFKKHKATLLGTLTLMPGWTGWPLDQEELQNQGVDLLQNR